MRILKLKSLSGQNVTMFYSDFCFQVSHVINIDDSNSLETHLDLRK